MRKKRTFSVALVLIVLLALCGCRKGIDGTQTTDPAPTGASGTAEQTTVTEEETTAANTAPESRTDAVEQTMAAEPTAAPTTQSAAPTAQPEPSETAAQPQPAAGVTSRGFTVTEVNGITYVDGVMIANKTYSLPKDYAPGDLTSDTYAAFYKMQSAAANDGINLFILSGYRSYDLQTSLYNRYVAADGKAAADRYSARPGHSEHQTGYAMDLNSLSQSFADTAEGKWIAAHCHEYGFVLRYPRGKEDVTGYMYEPWHLRYLGVERAVAIFNSGLTVEEYYGITSEYAG